MSISVWIIDVSIVYSIDGRFSDVNRHRRRSHVSLRVLARQEPHFHGFLLSLHGDWSSVLQVELGVGVLCRLQTPGMKESFCFHVLALYHNFVSERLRQLHLNILQVHCWPCGPCCTAQHPRSHLYVYSETLILPLSPVVSVLLVRLTVFPNKQ